MRRTPRLRAPRTAAAAAAAAGLLALAACHDATGPRPPADARPIVFAARILASGWANGFSAIYAVRGDGSDLHLVTPGFSQAFVPAWSHDGSAIAFASGTVAGNELWMVDADGSDFRRQPTIVACDVGYARIAWSPWDDRLAAECGGRTSVFDLIVGTTSPLSETIGRGVAYPDWSPDGTRLLFADPAAGSDALAVAPYGGDVATVLADAREATWSPDGTRIAFVADGSTGRRSVFVANVDGSGRRQLTAPTAPTVTGAAYDDDETPAWSADSRWLAFARRSTRCTDAGPPPSGCDASRSSVYVVRADGAGLRRVTPDSIQASRPSW